MIRNLAAKPALVVLGSATLAVLAFATLTGIYVSVQNSRTASYSVRPATFQQFDTPANKASGAPGVDSSQGAEAAMAQSGDGFETQKPSPDGQSRSVESFDAGTSAAGQAPQYGQGAQDGQIRQYGQPAQYGQTPPQVSQAAYGSASATGWTHLVSPDGSATVALPANWRIVGGAKGSVEAEGPSREQVILGYQTFVTANQAPYMAPEQALAWFMRSHGVKLLGIQDRKAQQASSGQAELIIAESEIQGRTYKGVLRVTTAQIGMGNWMLQISSMGAPVEQFDADFPSMQKIWNSWSLDPSYVRNAFQTAAAMNQQTAATMANGAMARFNGWQPFNESFDQTLRGVSTMENQSLGKRVETPLGSEQQYLNNCARNGQDCRQVPMNELVPQQ
jgi:hypothetical protein